MPEDRGVANGRMLSLKVIVIPTRAAKSREPVYFLSGGPGQAATNSAANFATSWHRDSRDVVLMDLRGTGEGTRLDCALGGSDDNLQGYLDPLFNDVARVARCRDELSRSADLKQYTTPNSLRDLDELRQALGHQKITLESASYGTRAALTYLQMFREHVHAAVLISSFSIDNRAPLFHAAAAQYGIDQIVRQCAAEAACHAAFPDPIGDMRAVIEQLRAKPAAVTVPHPVTKVPTELTLTARAFSDGLRVMLYSPTEGRRVPLLLQRARAGDVAPFAQAAMQSSRGMLNTLRFGLLLSITCSEDVWRIRPDEIARETGDSFIGDYRVRDQIAACGAWPRGQVDPAFYDSGHSTVPVLIISGNVDPVTPPYWGERVHRQLPKSAHIVLPAAHSPFTNCVAALTRQLFDRGSADNLDTSCVASERLPAFELPNER